MQSDTTLLGFSPQDALESPYVASMGVYVFKKRVLLDLLKKKYPRSNDFGSEIIPAAVKEHNVQAYIFRDYWEDIGTIKSFYDANLALTKEFPKFQFYDPKTPFFTSPQFLPPAKIEKSRVVDAIISHGCFLQECSVQSSIVGERSRLDYGVELKGRGRAANSYKHHWLVEQKLLHFIDAFHQYVMDRVYHNAWRELCEGMAAARPGLVDITAKEDSFIFTVESTGAIKASQLLLNAIEILKQKLDAVRLSEDTVEADDQFGELGAYMRGG